MSRLGWWAVLFFFFPGGLVIITLVSYAWNAPFWSFATSTIVYGAVLATVLSIRFGRDASFRDVATELSGQPEEELPDSPLVKGKPGR